MATKLGDAAVGSVVKVLEGGVLVDYLVVHQGRPSALYAASCDGTWCLRRDLLPDRRAWNVNGDTHYSDMRKYLNETYLAKLDGAFQEGILEIRIPYQDSANSVVYSGEQGMSCRVFLLAGYEIGWTQSSVGASDLPIDGAKLAYFTSGMMAADLSKRIAKLNGNPEMWWLRSAGIKSHEMVWCLKRDGVQWASQAISALYLRPAFILPPEMVVTSSGQVIRDPAGLYVKKSGAWARS